MKFDAFLFDLDGVIVDTAIYHYKAWKRLANELGFDIDEEFNEKLKGISRIDSLMLILQHGNLKLSETEIQAFATKKNEWYLEYISQMTSEDILPGVRAFFDDFKKYGIKCALGSASKNAPIILEKIGLLAYFDAIVDGNSVSKSKPDPEVFLLGAKLLGVENQQCVVFEDAIAGVAAAKSANMKAVGIGDVSVLTNADIVFPTFEGVTTAALLDKL